MNYFQIWFLTFQEICLAAYRGVVQPESEDKRIISAQWAKDEDIARFLRWKSFDDSFHLIYELII